MKRKLGAENRPVPSSAAPVGKSEYSFARYGLDARLLQAVAKAKFAYPTPVQAQTIPLALSGKDILGKEQYEITF